MKQNNLLKTSLLLGAITAILAVSVFLVNNITKTIIAESEATKLNSYYESIFPDCKYEIIYDKEKDGDKSSAILNIAEAKKGNETVGYLYLAATSGYSSQVTSLVGIDMAEAKLISVIITKQSETPGLGSLSTEPAFLDQFKEKSTDEVIKAKENVTAITGATITSKAVVNNVNESFTDFNSNYRK